MSNRHACRSLLVSFAYVLASFVPDVRADEAVVAAPSEELRANFKLAPYYKKAIVLGGFPIVSSEKVSDYALSLMLY